MNLEKELRSAWRIVVSICRIAWWCVVTTWLGASALWQFARLLSRWPDIASQTMHCPRGHKVPTHGVFECRCGALHEGWVFGHCRVCREVAGWTPCPKCKLPVRSPLE